MCLFPQWDLCSHRKQSLRLRRFNSDSKMQVSATSQGRSREILPVVDSCLLLYEDWH